MPSELIGVARVSVHALVTQVAVAGLVGAAFTATLIVARSPVFAVQVPPIVVMSALVVYGNVRVVPFSVVMATVGWSVSSVTVKTPFVVEPKLVGVLLTASVAVPLVMVTGVVFEVTPVPTYVHVRVVECTTVPELVLVAATLGDRDAVGAAVCSWPPAEIAGQVMASRPAPGSATVHWIWTFSVIGTLLETRMAVPVALTCVPVATIVGVPTVGLVPSVP